jgi:type IV pilus assembly protein PilY1
VNVTSYFIVDPTKINTTTTAYAQAGGTGVPLPLDGDPEKLIATLQDIFRQILSVSTTFVAASVPVNVFNRAEIINNVYIALFKADEDAKPQWPGNVKKFKVSSLSADDPFLVDAENDSAIAADGRITFDALSFWTVPATLPAPDTAAGEVAGKDGRTVERGGAGQKLPGFTSGSPGALNSATGARQLFYDTSGGTLAALNADAATAGALQASLGTASVAESEAMIAWARGQDVDDLDGDNNETEAREWIMGDLLHSRPLPINYGARDGYTKANPAIFIAAGSNDGYLHFFRNTTTAGAESGAEVWGFMPQAVMEKISVLRTNATGIKHPILVDGSPVSYLGDTNSNGSIDSGEEAWLFLGLRRGGTQYYGLDISNPTSPSLLWTIENSGDFAELGETFSDPRVIQVATASGNIPALIFGGGFDTNKDADAMGTDDTVGDALYIVNAETGELIWKAVGGAGADSATVFTHEDLVDSIPSAVAVLDSDGDGVQDRAYVGDTGGNVWRADFQGADTAEWKLTKLATLGRHDPAAGGKTDDRRFFHRPDIVQSLDEDGPFDAVIVGSGDREDPLDKGGATDNWVFMIKDRNVAAGATQVLVTSPRSARTRSLSSPAPGETCSAALTDGWALNLDTTGEKSLATATTISNTVYFTTYVPGGQSSEGSCGPSEGTGRLYAVSLFDASARRNYDVTTETYERYTELDSQGIPAEVVSLPPNSILRPDLNVEQTGAPTRFETYWYQAEDGDL